MLDALTTLSTSPQLLAMLLVAVPIGLIFGVIPGVGGKVAIIAMLPFVFGMSLEAGCVFLISLHAVVHTGGAVPSILFGIPGGGPSTATVMDGYALARKGEAARALSAATTASAVGGVFGAVFLAVLIPISTILVKELSYPEIFFLALFGISIAAMLSGNEVAKGLLTGTLGLAIAFLGVDKIFGADRFTFGQHFLADGIDVVTAVLALYAIPEMIEVTRGDGPMRLGAAAANNGRQWVEGAFDVWRHRWLTLRTSALGSITGLVPGLGGDVAAWLCYGHAMQSSKAPETFGHGAIEGVIGPEAANNSKEGGALAPTLFLGIPGSSGMAVLLVALVPLGLNPGPSLAIDHPGILWLMVWALALSNILASLILVLCSAGLDRLSGIDTRYLVPFVYVFSLISIDIASGDARFFLVTIGLAAIGYAFQRQGWPRAPFVIGLILGPAAEDALIKSIGLLGADFFLRPVSLVLIAVLFVGFATLGRRLARRGEPPRPRKAPRADAILAAFFLLVFAVLFVTATRLKWQAGLAPMMATGAGFLLAGQILIRIWATRGATTAASIYDRADIRAFAGFLVATACIGLFGFKWGGALYVAGYMLLVPRAAWARTVLLAAALPIVVDLMIERSLGVSLFRGLLLRP